MSTEPDLITEAVYRTARKPWRCTCADDLRGFTIRTTKSSDPEEWGGKATGMSRCATGTTRAEAEELAAAKVGAPAAYRVDPETGDVLGVSATYTAAWVEDVPNPNASGRAADCRGAIEPGDRYVEYLGEATTYESGVRYCLPCGIASWAAR